MRIAYLGPPGTYTHEALLAGPVAGEPVAADSIHDVVLAVAERRADRGVVPIENSLEGSVNATLDALAFSTRDVRIVGEAVRPIHHCLLGPAGLALGHVQRVVSHPQALGQCARYLRETLPGAELEAASSTAAAIRAVMASPAGSARTAALGPRSAGERYGATVLADDVEDVAGNVTRFAWLARAGAPLDGAEDRASGPLKTAIVLWPQESDHAGWLVDCLSEFATRGVNLTRIESRPRKVGLGEYVFFLDLAGAEDDPGIAAGLDGLRGRAAQLRVLGSFPVARAVD